MPWSTCALRLRAPHIPSPDVRLRPPGFGSLGFACAGRERIRCAIHGCAGQIRRLLGHGEPEASSTKARGVSREDAPVAKHDAYSLRLTPRASRRGGSGLPMLREPAYADERSHGWRSEVGVERAEGWRPAANVRRWSVGSHEPASYFASSQARRPFCTCILLAASSTTRLCGPSMTSSVTSSPRRAGRQCMKKACGQWCMRAAFTW
jgi:hypothetical protein